VHVPYTESGILSVIKALTRLLLNPEFLYHTPDSLPHVSILSHKNPIHVFLSCSLNIEFNIVHFVHSGCKAKKNFLEIWYHAYISSG